MSLTVGAHLYKGWVFVSNVKYIFLSVKVI